MSVYKILYFIELIWIIVMFYYCLFITVSVFLFTVSIHMKPETVRGEISLHIILIN